MKKLFVSIDEFKSKIIESDEYCFMCLAHRSEKQFNNEHILPRWILKRFNLFDQQIILPNKSNFIYGRYVIPCCEECNSALSKFYEEPISELLKKPCEEVAKDIKTKPKLTRKLFHWMCLIFIKTHLKTTMLNLNRNPNVDDGKISDLFNWNDLHHIYLMSRVHYTSAIIDNRVYGSVLVLKAQTDKYNGFDFADSALSRCMLLKLDEICILCCFDDCRSGIGFISTILDKVKPPLHPLQLKEVLAHLSYFNMNLKERPTFSSMHSDGHQTITVNLPAELPTMLDKKDQEYSAGDFLSSFAEPALQRIENREGILSEIKAGTRAYLFDKHGDFFEMNF